MLKLPKDVVADPRHDLVLALLTSDTRLLWEKGANEVATLPLTLALGTELRRALATNMASRGLEEIAKELDREQKGLDALIEKTPNPQGTRISRVLFFANDGSERFYRDCDSLLSRYPQRLLGCRLDATGEGFGIALFGEPKLVRALLITDKKTASRALLSLVKN